MSFGKREIICLQCPFACRMQVEIGEDGSIHNISNFNCPRGKAYAEQEVISPVRVLTTTVKIVSKDQEHPLLPVQSHKPIPKHLLFPAMKALAKIVVKPPIKYGEVIYPNLLDSGIDVVSSNEVLK